MAFGASCFFLGNFCIFRCSINRYISGHCLLYQFIRFADTVRNLNFDQLFTIESIHRNFCVCCHDDAVCIFDLFRSQHVFRSARTSCLYFNETSFRFCSLFQTFRCHVSMCDTGRACCDSQNTELIFRGRFVCFQFFIQIRCFLICFIDDLHKFFRAFCILQCSGKILIHQKYGKFAQYVQMYVVFGIRCCNQKDQMYRLSIKRIVIYTVLYNHRCQSRLIYKCTFSVRDRNPLSDTCRSFLFTAVYFLAISFQVIDFSTLCHQFDHLVESFVLGFWSTVDPDASLIQQFCDPHKFSFLTFLFCDRFSTRS